MIKQRLDDETLGNGALRTGPCVEIDTAIFQTGFQIWKKTFDKSKEHMRITLLLALLTDRGMASNTATSLLIGVGLATILGRLISGFLLDRVFAPHLAAGIFLIPLIGMTTLLLGGASLIAGLAAAICFGFSLGAEVDIVGYLVSRYFGLRRYGEIYGYIFAIFTIGSGVGPYLMGLSFDETHSYSAALGTFCIMLIVASATISRLGPYRFPAKATGKWVCGKGEPLELVAPGDHGPECAA